MRNAYTCQFSGNFFLTIFVLTILLLLSNQKSSHAQAYFQQEVNYTIDVQLDDEKHELNAFESFEYINNSPDELKFLYIHIWPNAYKNNSTALAKDLLKLGKTAFHFAKEKERGFIDSLDFKVDGKKTKWEILKDSIDICKVYLDQPLKSGDTINVSTPFHVQLPSGEISRLGHIDQSYQITQWYPKPAVYDKNGWNQLCYINQGEFYSEFGSFDVSITLPKNYVLGATGDRVNSEEEDKWMMEKVMETRAIEHYDRGDLSFPPSDSILKTVHFQQKNVHDFAWFCDKRYHVLKGGIITPRDKREITTWAMFTNADAPLWTKSIEYMNDALFYYSKWIGDYSYNNCTAVDGTISAGGGMEYPNITVIGSSENAFQLDLVITHEVGHNWFYGMLGSNERKHPWLDEGINSFYENRYVEEIYLDKNLIGNLGYGPVGKILDLDEYKHKKEYEIMYLLSAATHEDQPIETPSKEFTSFNYGADVYSKTALVFDYMMAYLQENSFDDAMQEYFRQWKFKHPQPDDLRKIMEESTGKKLDWFFDDLIGSTKKMDYKIKFTEQMEGGAWNLGVKNKGEINGPIFIQGFKDDKKIGEIMFEGAEGKQLFHFPPAAVDYFKIDADQNMPEINRNNNFIRTKRSFKKVEPLKLQFLGSLDHPDKTQLFYTPVAGWNNYNKWMFGLLLHNTTIPQKQFEFQLMPMYSYVTNDLTGYGKITYNRYPKNNSIQKLSIGGTATRYTYSNYPFDLNFNKIAPEINIQFKKKVATSPFTHSISYRNISIIREGYNVNVKVDAIGRTVTYRSTFSTKNYNDLNYIIEKKHPIIPYSLKLNFQEGDNMFKTSLTGKYRHNYKGKNKGFDLRFFAGTFIGTNALDAGPYRFRLSGQTGYQDYLYDDIFLGRTEGSGVFASQFTATDGGFKLYTIVGQTAKWITALNLKSSLGNLKLPLGVYADIGLTEYDGRLNGKVLYNAGAYISIIKDVFEIYFPLKLSSGYILMSEDFKENIAVRNIKYAETIRFTLNLKLVNPFDLVKKYDQ